MAKIGLFTVISVLLNLFLTFWLVNQYISDAYFQAYVNSAIGQYYPFIVLTLGIGGGSGVGYLFLKRKHGDTGLVGKIQKSKHFKPASPLTTTLSTSPSKQVLPAGAPPAPGSKHTVYAVPPLPRTSTPGSSRSMPSTTWASTGGKSPLESILSQKQDSAKPSVSETPPSRFEASKPISSTFSSITEIPPPQPLRSIADAPSKPGTTWSQPSSPPAERRSESGPIFQKPGMDLSAKPDQSFTSFSSQRQEPQTTPVPSKWAPSDEKTGTTQWPEGGVKSIPPLPTKWSPPAGTPVPQERLPPPQGLPRPGPIPTRSPLPPQQGGPRPFVIQGPGGPRPDQQRPIGPPRPIAAPQPFRPDPNRPSSGVGGQPRQGPPMPRPAAPLAGPMPQPWTPSQTAEKKEQSNPLGGSPFGAGGSDASAGKQGSEQKNAPEGSGGGEMDWDTALDTILKTLRKDRVGDTK